MDSTKQEEVAETYVFSLSYTPDKKGISLSVDNSTEVQKISSQISYQSESTILLDTVSYFEMISNINRRRKKLAESYSQVYCNNSNTWTAARYDGQLFSFFKKKKKSY